MSESQASATESTTAFEERLAVIRTLVQQRLHREVETVSPLGRDSNNFVNLVQLKESSLVQDANHDVALQHGTHKLDPSINRVVVRISNPGAMLDEDVRVENEVAAITLMQRALANSSNNPIPKVFAWEASSSTGSGWIVEEFMAGEKLSQHLPNLSVDEIARIFDQVAEILGKIQVFDPKVDGFGGLKFDASGRVVAGRSSLWSVGPFTKYADWYQGIFDKQLEMVATTPLLDGWSESGLRERLHHFGASGGLRSLLRPFENMKSTLVHGDISAENILINPC